jgi:DNA adenine methylase
MSEEDHHNLLTLIRQVQGKVMISGYRSLMYDDLLSSWTRRDFDLPNNAAGGNGKRRMTECLWCNF